ncbi:hypothetical protein [Paludisphaera soli]|uniref:hypothetical protein n=1 Tax=Paludisphaera soli TaxID=2712865 RepID=UPI0013EB44CE|nr:hypothetical protein [Paludisphaera soli]
MIAPLVCLLGLTLVGQDGPSVSALVRAPGLPTIEAATNPWAVGPARTVATPLDDEVEEFPDEPEGDDEDDPGEAMDGKGRSSASASFAALDLLPLDSPPPPDSPFAASPARPKGSPLSLLCRLRF